MIGIIRNMRNDLKDFKRKPILFVIVALTFLFPSAAHASWIGDKAIDAINSVLASIFEPIFDGMLLALNAILVNPTSMDGIPYVNDIKNGMVIIAICLLVTNVGFRGLMYMLTGTTGTNHAPMSDILGKAWISAILIAALPPILKDVLLPLNSYLMNWVQSIGVNFENGLLAMAFPVYNTLTNVIIFCVWLIAMVGLLWSNAVRVAELILLYFIGPLIAVSHSGRGEALQIWITQAVAVTFTQSLQYTLVGLSFNLMLAATYDWWTYLGGIGAVVLAIRGPQVIKQFLYSTGTAGGATSLAQQAAGTAIYRSMMKGVMK